MQKLYKKIAHACILVLALISFTILPLERPALADNPFESAFKAILQRFQPPSGKAGGRSRGGGGRGGGCPPVDIPITALAPKYKEQIWGLTVEEHPTLWFYVPYSDKDPSSDKVHLAKFMLLNEKKQPLLGQPLKIELSQTPGIIQLPLPYALETGKLYNWYFSIICDAKKPSRNHGVKGWIQRVEPSFKLKQELYQGSAPTRYIAYVENGIWYEALTQLAGNRRNHPQDEQLRRDWVNLLQLLELEQPDVEKLAQQPFVDCCSVKK